MALVSTLPNFFTSPSPSQVDFNNAAKALAQQVGGEYYDEGLATYSIQPGNIDSTNIISTGAGFRNGQKSEPRSFTSITTFAQVAAGAFVSFPVFGPFLYDATVIGIGLTASDGTYYISGGTFVIYLNGARLTSISINGNSGTTISSAAGDPSYATIIIPVRIGDALTIDPTDISDTPSSPLLFSTATRVQGTTPAAVSPTSDLNISLMIMAQHTK